MKDLGTAKTTDFMLGTAEVRIGAVGELFNLTSDDSIGLVKNVAITGEMESTDLGQGIKNRTVYSVITSSTLSVATEVYEYTAANLAYGLGLAAGNVSANAETTATAEVTGDDSVVALDVAELTDMFVDDYVLITTTKGIMANRIAALSAGSGAGTLTLAHAVPTGVTIASGAAVVRASDLDLGDPADIYYSCAVIGTLADGGNVVFYFPKIKIVRGFNVQFGTSDYGNMPFEMQPYSLVSSDADYAEFGEAQGKLIV